MCVHSSSVEEQRVWGSSRQNTVPTSRLSISPTRDDGRLSCKKHPRSKRGEESPGRTDVCSTDTCMPLRLAPNTHRWRRPSP